MKLKSKIVVSLLSILVFTTACSRNVKKDEVVISGSNGKYFVSPKDKAWNIEINSNENSLFINSIKSGVGSCSINVVSENGLDSVYFLIINKKLNKIYAISSDGKITERLSGPEGSGISLK